MIKHFTELVSKMATLPFTEFLFVREPLFANLLDSQNKYRDYELLKKRVQQELIGKQHIRSFDTLNLLLEQYFPLKAFSASGSEDELYVTHLNRLAKSFITHRNGRISLKYWKNANDEILFGAFEGLKKIELWNTLSRAFCIDILVVLHLLNNKMNNPAYLNGYYWLINLGDIQLDKVMERGLAETHIHISAGVNFNIMWHDLMNMNKEGSQIRLNAFSNLVDDPHMEQSLRVCSIIRILLFKYLLTNRKTDFNEYLEGYFGLANDSQEMRLVHELHSSLEWFLYRKNPPVECSYTKLNSFLLRDIFFDQSVYKTQHSEVIKAMSGLEKLHTTDENIFLFKVMDYLRSGVNDSLFSKLFWQYLRIKNVVYQGVTQGNFMEGLDYFRHFFSRATSIKSNHLEHAIRNQIYNNNLSKLEIRVTPSSKDNIHKIRQDLSRNLIIFFQTYKKLLLDHTLPFEKVPKIGIVYHLIKSQDDLFYEKCWYMDSDRRSLQNENYFYGSLQKKYKETIEAVNELREKIPGLSKYIVGLDAASVENNTEPWVFAPVFREARDSQTSKIRLLGHGEKINTLGFTYHVGEEFRHLLSGLRHIDEVIEHFNYHVGDRIGHGIALGIDVKSWCHENPVVVMPRIEYMENLLWLWGQAFMDKKYSLDLDLLGIEREVMLQAEKIYHNIDGITMFNLWKAYQGRFQPFKTDDKFIRDVCISETNRTGRWRNEIPMTDQQLCKQPANVAAIWNESKLIHANHCKCFLERMYEVIQVTVSENEVVLLERLQGYLRNKLNEKGIVVEANPTSNLAISGIERLFHHPVMNLNTQGLVQEDREGSGLVISINSDDPAVFNTSISNELSYIFYLLQDKGYPRDSILEWIEKIRDWGVMTSFIEDRKIDKKELIAEIDDIINQLK
ncbi:MULTISPECIES: hypothetical protein [Bacillales]|uniref:hypothetical protein n=1 Tax=Bacillales TaxID=1385 RepID=UPI000349E1DB|nr:MULTISPECIES: hypothetical protein [Bacillales]KMZ42851.1 hypothetical protein AC624_17935 [Bacillus sp. FJAT-27238]